VEQLDQLTRRIEFLPRSFYIADESDVRDQLVPLPRAELVATDVKQVRERLKLLPRPTVVRVLALAGIGPLARNFHFDKADRGAAIF